MLRSEPERGFAYLNQALPRGFRYTVWSYDAQPTAADLRRSAPEYPSTLADDGLLDVGDGVTLPPFGTPQGGFQMRIRGIIAALALLALGFVSSPLPGFGPNCY